MIDFPCFPRSSTLALSLGAATALSAAPLEFYRDIEPFLRDNCISCHNKTTTKAGLNMETPQFMEKGGDSGTSLIRGKGAQSLVVLAARHEKDLEMPPANNKSGAQNLSAEQIAKLTQWIDQGALAGSPQQREVKISAFAASVDPIYSVALSPDGQLAASGRANRIDLHDLSTRRQVSSLVAHEGMVQTLAFSPDGRQLASGSFREIKLWDVIAQPMQAAAAKPADAALLAQAMTALKLKGEVKHSLSADGQWLCLTEPSGNLHLLQTKPLKAQAALRGSLNQQQQRSQLQRQIAAQTLEAAFQGSVLDRIAAQDKALDVLLGKANEAITAMTKALPEKQKLVAPATEAAQKAKADADAAQQKLAAKPMDAALKAQLKTAQEKVLSTRMAETSAKAAAQSTQSNIDDAKAEQQRIAKAKAENKLASQAADSAKKAALAASSKAQEQLKALDKALPSSLPAFEPAIFSADGSRVAAVLKDGSVRVWGLASGRVVAETKDRNKPMGETAALKLQRHIKGTDFFVDRVNALRFSPDGRTLACAGGEPSRSGEITLIEAASGKLLKRWREHHSDSVLCLDFSPDGRRLASGAADKIARITDMASGKIVLSLEGHTHHVNAIAFRSDARVLATAGADGTVVTWDLLIGERKKKIEGWSKEVTSLQFIGASDQIAAASGDNRLRLVTDSGSEVRNISDVPDYLQSAAVSPDGSLLLAGGEDSILRLWDATNGSPLAVFKP